MSTEPIPLPALPQGETLPAGWAGPMGNSVIADRAARLAAIRARAEAAAEQRVIDPPRGRPYMSAHNMRVSKARRDFAKAALVDVPWLLAELAKVEAECDALRAVLADTPENVELVARILPGYSTEQYARWQHTSNGQRWTSSAAAILAALRADAEER